MKFYIKNTYNNQFLTTKEVIWKMNPKSSETASKKKKKLDL